MSSLPLPRDTPSDRKFTSMRPPISRLTPNLARERYTTSAYDGRSSRAKSVTSARANKSSPQAGVKRKARDYETQSEENNINVVVRCRGRNDRELRENSGVVVFTNGIKGSTVELSMGANALTNKSYHFDKVFSPAADQSMIFQEVVAPILDEVLGGFNCTIFAYGQTGTGKTYTMTGDISDVLPLPDAAGIIPRVLYSLFNKLESEETENSVKCSFIELYNEELRDLLSTDDSVKLKIFDDNNKKGHSTTLVQGMEECHLKTARQGIKILRDGSLKRQVASTKCNDLSSRSHTVFTITVYTKRTSKDGQEYLSAGKLNLVDLAGSENIQRSGAENKRAAEAGLINKSLLTLGRVINALVERKGKDKDSGHIPYRESKLTRLLQDSLGGQTKTCIIATLSPAKSNLEETISTLDYAFRAKNIRNKPQVSQLLSKKTLLKDFTSEIEKLKSELIATRQRNGVYLTQENYEEIITISESRRILSDEQRDKIETMEINLRNKVEELFNINTNFQNLKKDNEQTQLTLKGTKGILEKTEAVLTLTRQNLAQEKELCKAHAQTEGELTEIGYHMISTLEKTTADINGLRSKIRRKSEIQSQNRQRWSDSQSQISHTTQLVENRIAQLQAQQEHMIKSLSTRMQSFVKDELNKLDMCQTFLQGKREAFENSEQEVNKQNRKIQDRLNEVLGEIKMLRENVKQNVGIGLNELSDAAEKISTNMVTELDDYHSQLHSSYNSLGREFKDMFDELVKNLNEQQADNEMLHQQVLEANATMVQANQASQGQLKRIIDEEKQRSADERRQLLVQITSLINTNAEAQDKRLNERVSDVCEELEVANRVFEMKQGTYNKGMQSWIGKSRDILVNISKSRDDVESKIKSDFTTATQHTISIKDSTTSIHANTVKIVKAQMEQMDMQLYSSNEIVSRAHEQNNVHYTAHTAPLNALITTMQSSYTSISDYLSTLFARVGSVESDILAQTTALNETLPSLNEDAYIRAPLQKLRSAIANQNLTEYDPTGETPQRVSYIIPTKLPRTEAPKTPVSSLRDHRISVDFFHTPSKDFIFNDTVAATDGLSSSINESSFARPMGANVTYTTPFGASLRELDVNVLAQQESHTRPLPIASHSDTMVIAAPPSKKQRRDDNTKLPMKYVTSKTVSGEEQYGRENSTVGQGMASTRKLRSHGSGRGKEIL